MAKKSSERFKCGKCPEGIVTLEKKETRSAIELTIKKCSKCKAEYGLIGFRNWRLLETLSWE
ncbi:hypothetical protein MCERE19_02272 [Spirosomataceae bacterium]